MARTISFTIPGLPPTLNAWSRAHWSMRARMSKKWRDYAVLFGPRKGSPMWPFGTPLSPAVVTIKFYNGRKVDPDNLVKVILDGIVGARLIRDDGPPHLVELRLRSCIEKGNPRTEVLIEEVA